MASMKVSYSELEEAFLFASYGRHHWLDKHTGRVLSYCNEAAEALQGDDLSDLPDWMDDDLATAREVLRAFGELPEDDSQPPLVSDQLPIHCRRAKQAPKRTTASPPTHRIDMCK